MSTDHLLLVGAGLFVVTMLLSGLLTELVRRRVVALKMGQQVREDGPPTHLAKAGTPSLGGVGFLSALTVVTLLMLLAMRSLTGNLLWVLLLTLGYAAIGFADDYSKLRHRRALGLKARERLPLEFLLAAGFGWLLIANGTATAAAGPAQLLAFGDGFPWVIVVMFVLVGSGNAVNLTDGLDGLAGGTGAICALGLAGAAFMLGQPLLALWCLALAGALAGFLWLNAHPARIWMGDVGSLGLGAALGAVAVALRLELLYGLVFGLLFVAEALSVIIQVGFFKLTKGRRVFRMAPFHHHLELGGLTETQIVTRFWIAGVALALMGWGLVSVLSR